MKTKSFVIIQATLLIIGVSITLLGQYIGVNSSFWILSCILSNLCYGIGIGIGIGATNERDNQKT